MNLRIKMSFPNLTIFVINYIDYLGDATVQGLLRAKTGEFSKNKFTEK